MTGDCVQFHRSQVTECRREERSDGDGRDIHRELEQFNHLDRQRQKSHVDGGRRVHSTHSRESAESKALGPHTWGGREFWMGLKVED